ncbi:MAG TPA: c-type cytochrome [Thermodesulfobacteriota bacterium]|nr:c-type cytochrome [Thermodesulfobacteriota bacterium]
MALTKRAAFWIFSLGTLSSTVLFLALTIDTHRQVETLTHADKLSDQVVAGKRVWEKYNCNDCHTILGFGGYYAPDMTKAYKRLGEVGIRERVTKPEVIFANSWRKMPQQNLSPDEVEKLIHFFKWVGDIDTHGWPPQDSEKRSSSSVRRLIASVGMSPGAALFKEKGCLGCHRIGEAGSNVGPALDKVGSKFDKETLAQYAMDPKKVNPQSSMPAQDVQPQEGRQIAEFLAGLK